MTDRGDLSAGGSDVGAHTAQVRLAKKAKLAEKLFASLRPHEKHPNNAVRILSYDPGTENNQLDSLAGDNKNADIFTAQRWAALKAWNIFRVIVDNLDDLKSLQIESSKSGRDKEPDKFSITIVGSSVSGLTFHAALCYLFQKANFGVKLVDLFHIWYLDSHQRPMQRLLQARDRRIVPRFEYERLLSADLSRLKPGRHYSGREVARFLERGSDELVAHWNDTTGFKNMADLSDVFPDGLDFMPPELCWKAGKVRSVAKQILKGFEKITNAEEFRGLSTVQSGASSTGGPIFSSVVAPSQEDKKTEGSGKSRRFNIKVVPGNKTGSKKTDFKGTRGADFVLLATGQGVDISAQACEDAEDDRARPRFLANTQESFWNAPKMELDVVEPDQNQVLVLGNGDSAAGGIYSSLFRDPEACSYRFLTALLGHPAYREWFTRLQQHVENRDIEGVTTTQKWDDAFKQKAVIETMYECRDIKIDPFARAGADKLPNGLEDLLRTSVSVAVAIRADPEVPQTLREGEEAPALMRFSQDSVKDASQMCVEMRLLNKAWPENRIIGALLFDQIVLYQENSQNRGPFITPVADGSRLKRKIRYAVPLFAVPISKLSGDELKVDVEIFKYVLDCRGRTFFALRGNETNKLKPPPPKNEETAEPVDG